MAALLILGIVIITSLAALYGREARMQEAAEMVLVWQAIGSEATARRHESFGVLTAGAETPFLSDLSLLEPIGDYTAVASVEAASPTRKRVVLSVTWAEGKRSAKAILNRTDTGGGPVW